MSTRLLLSALPLLFLGTTSRGARTAGPVEIQSWTCSRQVRDLAAWNGKSYAATGGGLLEWSTGRDLRKLTTATGLPENDVLRLLPTPTGLVATFRRSLGRWDGRAWTALPLPPPSAPGEPPALACGNGELLATSREGLQSLDEARRQWRPVPGSPPAVIAVGVAGSHRYVLAGRALWRQDRTWVRLADLPVTDAAEVLGWARVGTEDLLVTRQAIYGWDDRGAVRTLPLNRVPGATHAAGFAVEGRRLLLAIHGAGLWSVDAALSPASLKPVAGAALPAVRCVLATGDGIWLGTGDGLVRRHGVSWEPQAVPRELPGGACVTLAAFDRQPWLATQDGDLARFDGTRWLSAPSPERGSVLKLDAAGGALWARHPDGSLSRFEGRDWRTYRTADEDRLTWTSGLWSAAGHLWVGTWGGVVRLTARSIGWSREPLVSEPGLEPAVITAVTECGNELWVGTQRRGIAVRSSEGAWRWFDESHALRDGWITALATNGKQVWAGTFNGGLACWSGSVWSHPDPLPTPAGRKITSLTFDRSGRLWVGTRGGLARFDGAAWTTWHEADGLAGEEIQSLLADGDDLWVGTRTGVSRLRVSSSNAGARGQESISLGRSAVKRTSPQFGGLGRRVTEPVYSQIGNPLHETNPR